MNGYDGPGAGWREVQTPPFEGEADYLTLTGANETEDRYWVREEEPVPPLPTEPYTVIRVTWAAAREPGVLIIAAAHQWVSLGGDGYRPEFVAQQISGFEVLAEPHGADYAAGYRAGVDQNNRTREERVRRETAKAVLDQVRQVRDISRGYGAVLDAIGRDFGVDA